MLSGKFTYLLLLKLLLLSFSNITCSCFDPSVGSLGILQVFSSTLDFWKTQLHGLQDSQPLQYETVLCWTNVWTKLLPLSGVLQILLPKDHHRCACWLFPFPHRRRGRTCSVSLANDLCAICPNLWALGGRVKGCKCGRTRGRASTQPQGNCHSCWVQAFPCGHFEANSWRSPLTPFSVSTVSKLIGFPRWTLVKSYLSLLLGRDFSNS